MAALNRLLDSVRAKRCSAQAFTPGSQCSCVVFHTGRPPLL
ncbi:hypothetical protein XOC_0309 [Xanthomonas oryzae pv. oryzicola BLS256]|uniref:Uncharacterized protein n=1 Tax=Xanthomonas oryzae pv. oryzicola (strain BLS256) TaxID=383407 RepID=G7TKM8_XANOB|nr:hypothetical protein XOC_0309 [Xanthomonas oryzae pv. oryzicola BLS256]